MGNSLSNYSIYFLTYHKNNNFLIIFQLLIKHTGFALFRETFNFH